MEPSEIRIGHDGTVKVTFVDRVKLDSIPPSDDREADVTYTFEEMLFRDST